MMAYYNELTYQEVISTYKLMALLFRLKATGTVNCETIGIPFDSSAPYDQRDLDENVYPMYGIKKLGYDRDRGRQDERELLEEIFGRLTQSQNFRGTP